MTHIAALVLLVSAGIAGVHPLLFWLSGGQCLPFVENWIPAAAWLAMFCSAIWFGYRLGADDKRIALTWARVSFRRKPRPKLRIVK